MSNQHLAASAYQSMVGHYSDDRSIINILQGDHRQIIDNWSKADIDCSTATCRGLRLTEI